MHVMLLLRSFSLAYFEENRSYKLDLNKHDKPYLDAYMKKHFIKICAGV